MTLPASGSISIQQVNYELGVANNTQRSLNDSVLRTLFAVASGAISMSNGYGKSNGFSPGTITIASNTTNYNLYNVLIGLGWNGTSAVNASVVINAGVTVSASTTGNYAFSVSGLPAGSTVNITNNGTIVGCGGAGGDGGGASVNGITGSAGGPAIYAASPFNLTNNGIIGGGGGGGGGGGAAATYISKIFRYLGGGGGGGGTGSGAGGGLQTGSPPSTWIPGNTGSSGTNSSGGAGGLGGIYSTAHGGDGGAGGSFGSSGAAGGSPVGGTGGTGTSSPGSNGAAGSAIVGTSNITYLTVGTIYGALV